MASLTQIAGNLIQEFGYGGVALGLFMNAIGIPIPSEIILPLAGVEVRNGSLTLVPLVIVAIVAQVAALTLSYAVARSGGLELVERYGKYVFIRRQELESAQRAFAKYGSWLVLFGLCLPAVHGYVGYPAGLGRMRLGKFLAAATIGSAVWTILLVGLGYFLGGHLTAIDQVLRKFGIVLVIVIAAAVVWWVRRQRRNIEATTHNLT